MRPRWHIFGNSEVVLDPVCQSRSSCLSSKTLELPTSKEAWLSNDRLLLKEVANTRSKKRRFMFQTSTETPTNTPSTLGFGITHQPHEGGDGSKCGAKFADTTHDIYIEVTGVHSE